MQKHDAMSTACPQSQKSGHGRHLFEPDEMSASAKSRRARVAICLLDVRTRCAQQAAHGVEALVVADLG